MTIIVMVLRQFSLRWLLLFTTACALVSLLIALSLDGSRWALGIVAALAAVVVVMLVHAILFAGVWLVTLVRGAGRRQVAASRPPHQTASRPQVQETPR